MNFRTTIQKELDSFFKMVEGSEFSIRKVTKSAFTQARSKMDPLLFKRLNKVASDTFYAQAKHSLWHNLRVLAVDGSRISLPNHPSIKEEFGEHGFGPKADANQSLGLISMLYDVLNLITLDSSIGKYVDSERDHLVNHLDRMQKGDLLLLDRGYPCFWLLFLLKAKGIEFCVRLKDDWWKQVNQFLKEAEMEKVVSFELPKKDREKLKEYPEYQNSRVLVRLIKVKLPNGEIEILCSSLTNQNEFKIEEFQELYHLRWREEEGYKLLKCRAELENWSGKTATAVKQDFYAKVFITTLLAAYKHPIEEKVKEEYKQTTERKYSQKINSTFALSALREALFGIFIKKKINQMLDFFDKIITQTREIIRPNRTNPRPKKPKRHYYTSYKHY